MTDIVIAVPMTAEAEADGADLLARAGAMTVRDQREHGDALGFLCDIARAQKAYEDLFREPKKTAHAAHKSVCQAEARLLEPLDRARRLVAAAVATYEHHERERAEREARAEAARREAAAAAAAAAAARDMEERAIREAEAIATRAQAQAVDATQDEADAILALAREDAEALVDGASEDAAAIRSEPVQIIAPQAAPRLATAAGVSTSGTWSAEVFDLAALIRHVSATPALSHLLMPAMPALNQIARAQKKTMQIPGVRSVFTPTIRVRTQ